MDPFGLMDLFEASEAPGHREPLKIHYAVMQGLSAYIGGEHESMDAGEETQLIVVGSGGRGPGSPPRKQQRPEATGTHTHTNGSDCAASAVIKSLCFSGCNRTDGRAALAGLPEQREMRRDTPTGGGGGGGVVG